MEPKWCFKTLVAVLTPQTIILVTRCRVNTTFGVLCGDMAVSRNTTFGASMSVSSRIAMNVMELWKHINIRHLNVCHCILLCEG